MVSLEKKPLIEEEKYTSQAKSDPLLLDPRMRQCGESRAEAEENAHFAGQTFYKLSELISFLKNIHNRAEN